MGGVYHAKGLPGDPRIAVIVTLSVVTIEAMFLAVIR
jgi:hypothetical protein